MVSSLHSLFLVSLPFLKYILPRTSAAPLQAGPTVGPLLIDVFDNPRLNALGQYHGGSGLGQFKDGEQQLIITTDDVDGKD
jgi:hypothetical protein